MGKTLAPATGAKQRCARSLLAEGAGANHQGQAGGSTHASPFTGKALPPASKAAPKHACLPASGKDAAAGQKCHAVQCTLPHHGKVLPPAKEAARHHAHFPIMGKTHAPATKVA